MPRSVSSSPGFIESAKGSDPAVISKAIVELYLVSQGKNGDNLAGKRITPGGGGA